MTNGSDLFISAGEVSGDIHGGRLLTALRRRLPGLNAFGIGGRRLQEAGLEKIADISELSLVGVAEVLPRILSIYRLLSRARSALAARRPGVVLLIDAPDFNLRLARHARRLGLKVIYFIGPTLWAWRPGRIREVERSVDMMLTILPFEEEIYRSRGVPVMYVGHPLLDSSVDIPSREDFLKPLGISPEEELIAVLPGSRPGEIRRLLPMQIEACRILSRRSPSPRFIFPAASRNQEEQIAAAVKKGLSGGIVVSGQAPECLAAARAAVVTSGSATLEAALQDTPFVTIYRLSAVSYLVGRLLVDTPWISLPNIILQESVVDELIQGDCRPERIASSLARLLDDEVTAQRMRRCFSLMRRKLGPGGAIERTASAVSDALESDS